MEDEKQRQRYGETIITSVSVSKEFAKLISQYNLSPTECFRRGIAVTLFDLGVAMYQSDKNKERFDFVQNFLKKIEVDEKLRIEFERIEMFEKVKKNLNQIKKIIGEIENERI
jgi:16S rRNA C1402 N4-methylase RsmH